MVLFHDDFTSIKMRMSVLMRMFLESSWNFNIHSIPCHQLHSIDWFFREKWLEKIHENSFHGKIPMVIWFPVKMFPYISQAIDTWLVFYYPTPWGFVVFWWPEENPLRRRPIRGGQWPCVFFTARRASGKFVCIAIEKNHVNRSVSYL